MEVNMLTGKGAGPILLIIAIFVLMPAVSAGDSNMTTADNIKRSNEFALKFFYEINRADPGDNTFISPFSMRAVLAMTLNGANGPTKEEMRAALGFGTKEEMRAALGFGGLSDDAINNYFQKITKALENTDPKVELNIANSVWMLTDAPFNRSFLDLVSNFYDAGVDRADDPEPINQWVHDKTNNKIHNIIERISPDDLMLLLNAVYFKRNQTPYAIFKLLKTARRKRPLCLNRANSLILKIMICNRSPLTMRADKFECIYFCRPKQTGITNHS